MTSYPTVGSRRIYQQFKDKVQGQLKFLCMTHPGGERFSYHGGNYESGPTDEKQIYVL